MTHQFKESLKSLAIRNNFNFSSLDEEKQKLKIEKIKAEVTRTEDILVILKEKYNRNNEECDRGQLCRQVRKYEIKFNAALKNSN